MFVKMGPFWTREIAGALIVDQGADEVGRQEIRRKLDPPAVAVDRGRQAPHRQGLGQPGQALEQQVPVGEEADQEPFEQHLLSHDDPSDFGEHVPKRRALAGDLRRAGEGRVGAETGEGVGGGGSHARSGPPERERRHRVAPRQEWRSTG